MKSKFTINSLKPFMDVEGLKGDEVVERKQFIADIKMQADEERTVIAKITTMDCDADGDCIVPDGVDLKRFMSNPIIHINHSYKVEDVVGKATELAINEKGITAKIKFAETPRAEDCWSLLKGGFVRANSIGFIIKEAYHRGTEEFTKYITEKKLKIDDNARRLITKWELLENSIVSLPCNPMALMQAVSAKSINLSDKTIKELDLDKVVIEEVKPEVPVEEVVEAKEEVMEAKEEVVEAKEEVVKVCGCEGCTNPDCICTGNDCSDEACECDGDCECGNEEVVEESVKEPEAPEEPEAAIVEEVEKVEIVRTIKVIRSGSWDRQAELRKYLDIKSGKIV